MLRVCLGDTHVKVLRSDARNPPLSKEGAQSIWTTAEKKSSELMVPKAY